ncbi:MAG: hypothetical protein GY754_39080 [bacterium]|nr:hypothetical protein [bacterium]
MPEYKGNSAFRILLVFIVILCIPAAACKKTGTPMGEEEKFLSTAGKDSRIL